jgi:hypothetical protein
MWGISSRGLGCRLTTEEKGRKKAWCSSLIPDCRCNRTGLFHSPWHAFPSLTVGIETVSQYKPFCLMLFLFYFQLFGLMWLWQLIYINREIDIAQQNHSLQQGNPFDTQYELNSSFLLCLSVKYLLYKQVHSRSYCQYPCEKLATVTWTQYQHCGSRYKERPLMIPGQPFQPNQWGVGSMRLHL